MTRTGFAFAISLALLLLASGTGSAATLQISNANGNWACGFYPGQTGYGSTTTLTFTSQDAQGNPISANLNWGNPHASPQCTPGMQVFQDTVVPGGEGALGGQWSYLGKSYSTIPGGGSFEACIQPGCYLSVSVEQSGDIALTLGFESSSGPAFLNFVGMADITSSSFGQQPITLNGVFIGDYYFSKGTFTVVPAPEPVTWSLLSCGVFLAFAYARRGRRCAASQSR